MARRILDLIWTDNAEEHIWEHHRLTMDDVDEAVRARPFVRRGKQGLFYVYGQTDAGRHVFIVLAELRDGQGLVVTARSMTRRELRVYRRRGK